MNRARLVQWIATTLTAGAISVVSATSLHAQATVETGGATSGAATNVTTLAPDFSGMATTITSTAAPTPGAIASEPARPDQINAPEPPANPDLPESEDMPDQPERAGDE